MYMNSTVGVPFQVWGDVPLISLETFADSMSPLDPVSDRPEDIAAAQAVSQASGGVRIPLNLAQIQSLPLQVPFRGHIAPRQLNKNGKAARNFSAPLDADPHMIKNNEWWKLPVDATFLMPYEDMIRRMVGVNNISDIDLRFTGSKGVNLVSEVLSESFEVRMNKISDDDKRCNGVSSTTEQVSDNRKAVLNVGVTSDGDSVDAHASLFVKYFPVPFAISSRHIVVQVEDNHTKWLSDPFAEQAWIARAQLLPFRLISGADELEQDPVLIKIGINASDNGRALAQTISSIVDGYDTNLVITDAQGRIYNDFDVIVDKADARGVIQVRFDPAKLLFQCSHATNTEKASDCKDEAGHDSAANFTIVRPKSVSTASVGL
jgi:hypothetical protein